jgi:hypothetical protein
LPFFHAAFIQAGEHSQTDLHLLQSCNFTVLDEALLQFKHRKIRLL